MSSFSEFLWLFWDNCSLSNICYGLSNKDPTETLTGVSNLVQANSYLNRPFSKLIKSHTVLSLILQTFPNTVRSLWSDIRKLPLKEPRRQRCAPSLAFGYWLTSCILCGSLTGVGLVLIPHWSSW